MNKLLIQLNRSRSKYYVHVLHSHRKLYIGMFIDVFINNCMK